MCWRGGGTKVTTFLDEDFDTRCDGTDTVFGNDLVIATGGKIGHFEMGTWISHGGAGGTPNGINGHDSNYSTGAENTVQLPNVTALNGTDYGKYGGVNGITIIQTRAPDPGTKNCLQGGSGGIITTTLNLPSGTFTITVGKHGQDIVESVSTNEINYVTVSGSRDGCILVEYGEGISL